MTVDVKTYFCKAFATFDLAKNLKYFTLAALSVIQIHSVVIHINAFFCQLAL